MVANQYIIKKYLKTKIKSYGDKININFQNDEIPKGFHCVFLSVMMLGSVFKMGKNYFPQVFLEECKYIVKEKKMRKFINDDLGISSDESDEETSHEETSDA